MVLANRPSRHHRGPIAGLILGACLLAVPAPGPAQSAPEPHDHRSAEWTRDLAIGGANALVGGAAAAVRAWLHGAPIADAFLGGAVGGGIHFAGKRLAAEGFDGAGLLGRQVGAVGSSMVANAGVGEGLLHEVWLPVGPLRLGLTRREAPRVRVSAFDVGALAWAATRPELAFDWSASLSDGVVVVRASGHELVAGGDSVRGLAMGGLVLLGAAADPWTRVHERVHVIQYDFILATFDRPLEAWAWRRIGGWRPPLDTGLGFIPLGFVFDNPLQAEAYELEERR